MFAVLPDDPAIDAMWKRLVTAHGVIGNQVYDARLVAAMRVHGIGRVLAFDAEDFARYEIEIIHPSAVSVIRARPSQTARAGTNERQGE